MSSFQQCKYCNTFLLSSDPIVITNHATRCPLNSSPEASTNITEKHDNAGGYGMEHFRWISFPELRIPLSQSTSTQPPLFSSVKLLRRRNRQSKPARKKTRVRYPPTNPAKDFDLKPDLNGGTDSSGVPYIRAYRFDCKQCPGKFYSKVEYDRHMNVHNGSRKTMKCIVCLRLFNKRDSLNQHYAAHENAEEREENLNLMHSWPKKTSENPYARIRQACKYCLLVHTNKDSFVNHMQSDHGGESSMFPCCLDNCPQEFEKIRDLLLHAKKCHPLAFYGKFTLNRLKGEYAVRTQRKDEPDKKGPSTKLASQKPKKKKVTRRKKKKASLEESDYSEDEIFSGSSTTRKAGPIEGFGRAVELERVHIVDGGTAQNCSEGVTMKKENTQFYSNHLEDIDSFLTYNGLTDLTGNNSVVSLDNNEQPSNDNDSFNEDSIPIVSRIKIEPII